ncbi:MAG: hypothetical protein LYZ69_01435 [Nitrososphaerales archaeon]|nr:hypothetical protein [Nitrososphaerales archaeon]
MTARKRASRESREMSRIAFDRRVDGLVSNVMKQDLLSPEFRTEYVKATSLFKRVAEFDPGLASELFFSAMMLSYTFAVGVTDKIFRWKGPSADYFRRSPGPNLNFALISPSPTMGVDEFTLLSKSLQLE